MKKTWPSCTACHVCKQAWWTSAQQHRVEKLAVCSLFLVAWRYVLNCFLARWLDALLVCSFLHGYKCKSSVLCGWCFPPLTRHGWMRAQDTPLPWQCNMHQHAWFVHLSMRERPQWKRQLLSRSEVISNCLLSCNAFWLSVGKTAASCWHSWMLDAFTCVCLWWRLC